MYLNDLRVQTTVPAPQAAAFSHSFAQPSYQLLTMLYAKPHACAPHLMLVIFSIRPCTVADAEKHGGSETLRRLQGMKQQEGSSSNYCLLTPLPAVHQTGPAGSCLAAPGQLAAGPLHLPAMRRHDPQPQTGGRRRRPMPHPAEHQQQTGPAGPAAWPAAAPPAPGRAAAAGGSARHGLPAAAAAAVPAGLHLAAARRQPPPPDAPPAAQSRAAARTAAGARQHAASPASGSGGGAAVVSAELGSSRRPSSGMATLAGAIRPGPLASNTTRKRLCMVLCTTQHQLACSSSTSTSSAAREGQGARPWPWHEARYSHSAACR